MTLILNVALDAAMLGVLAFVMSSARKVERHGPAPVSSLPANWRVERSRAHAQRAVARPAQQRPAGTRPAYASR